MADKPRYRGIVGPDGSMHLQAVSEDAGSKPRFRARFEDGQVRIKPVMTAGLGAVETPEAETLRILGNQQRGGPVQITYFPTPTSDPSDPRTAAAGYDKETQTLRVEWGDGGAPYNYYNVSPSEWRNFRRVKSPGRAINRVLNAHPYGPA